MSMGKSDKPSNKRVLDQVGNLDPVPKNVEGAEAEREPDISNRNFGIVMQWSDDDQSSSGGASAPATRDYYCLNLKRPGGLYSSDFKPTVLSGMKQKKTAKNRVVKKMTRKLNDKPAASESSVSASNSNTSLDDINDDAQLLTKKRRRNKNTANIGTKKTNSARSKRARR